MLYLLPIAVPVLAFAGITRHLKGPNLAQYDEDIPVTYECDPNSEGLQKINTYLYENFAKPAEGSARGEPIKAKRARFDEGGLNRDFPSTFTPLEIGNMTGEWVTAKKSNPDKRILYIHGGAFTVGSALSHRSVTSQLAEITGASVCAINYRLLPENARKAGIEDCREAYRWILENGPKGKSDVKKLAVMGDSAGGNLTLSLIQWVRDTGLRPADAVVPLSPLIDSTFSGPSIRSNLDSDRMLKPMIGQVARIPKTVLLWGTWKETGYAPSSPEISPIFGDLSDLPPTLIQASSTEILYDDARRYTAKARRAGNDITLQTWSHMPHVFQAFDTMLPEATDAMKLIAKFLKKHGV
jgi:acetyl esterase/lipase